MKRHAEQRQQQESEIEELSQSLAHDIQVEEVGFVRDIGQFLQARPSPPRPSPALPSYLRSRRPTQSHTRNEARRKQALHSEWHEKVYDRVQRKIDAELSRRSSKEVTERLNAQVTGRHCHCRLLLHHSPLTTLHSPLPPSTRRWTTTSR